MNYDTSIWTQVELLRIDDYERKDDINTLFECAKKWPCLYIVGLKF